MQILFRGGSSRADFCRIEYSGLRLFSGFSGSLYSGLGIVCRLINMLNSAVYKSDPAVAFKDLKLEILNQRFIVCNYSLDYFDDFQCYKGRFASPGLDTLRHQLSRIKNEEN